MDQFDDGIERRLPSVFGCLLRACPCLALSHPVIRESQNVYILYIFTSSAFVVKDLHPLLSSCFILDS